MNTSPYSTDHLRLRPMVAADWSAVSRIYAEGIASGQATFESRVPEWAGFAAGHHSGLRWVADAGGTVLGWAAASPVSRRAVYDGVAEHSVYVAGEAHGKGVGMLLLQTLVAAADHSGIWTLQCGIFPENAASLALHQTAGFRIVGRRERIGKMTHGPHAGQWRDTLLLERRSTVVGTD